MLRRMLPYIHQDRIKHDKDSPCLANAIARTVVALVSDSRGHMSDVLFAQDHPSGWCHHCRYGVVKLH
jgi:hypothetical protein